MIRPASGFITTGVDTKSYKIGSRPPQEGPWWNTSFFDCSAVKAIGQTHHCQIAGRSAEFAAARGSCGKKEVIKA